jgi:hypothetical protein
MNRDLVLLPLLLQAFTTLIAYLQLRLRRDKASAAGLVNEQRRALHDDAWPEHVLQINNNIRNQFELPTLFYVLSLVLWCIDFVGPFVLGVATLFSLSRMVHLYIHTGSNYVPHRRRAFTFGLGMVTIMFFVAATGVLSKVLG